MRLTSGLESGSVVRPLRGSCALTGRGRRDLIGACASRYPSLSCPLARLVRAAPLPRMDRRDDMPTMTYPTTASEQTYIEVTGGVDTHKDTHTAAALDASGRLLGHREFAATAAGYAALLAWLGTLGQLVRVGVEGSGVYGAGLARFLQAAGVELVEVDRPDRKTRRRQGKSDPGGGVKWSV